MQSIITPTDNVEPGDKWEFNGDVAAAFDDMLERSIPQYDIMRQACFEVGKQYVKHGTDIVDLGCSRGEALSYFVDEFGAQCRYAGIEVSEPMLEASRERFKGMTAAGIVRILPLDLREKYPPVVSSLTLAVLTIQFIPIEYRQKIIRRIYDHTIPGGALILVEKVLGGTARIDDTMVSVYYGLKKQNGYSQEQIERKRLSLEGVLVPVTSRWNEELLKSAGFDEVDCFWRWMNFAGWIAIKH